MEQIERIQQMEDALNASTQVILDLQKTLDAFAGIGPLIEALQEYYFGPVWRQDCVDDADGKLPKDLKRGVLSQDAVWNLLTDYKAIRDTMQTLCK